MSKTQISLSTGGDRLGLAPPSQQLGQGSLEVNGEGGSSWGCPGEAGERMYSTSEGEDMGVEKIGACVRVRHRQRY